VLPRAERRVPDAGQQLVGRGLIAEVDPDHHGVLDRAHQLVEFGSVAQGNRNADGQIRATDVAGEGAGEGGEQAHEGVGIVLVGGGTQLIDLGRSDGEANGAGAPARGRRTRPIGAQLGGDQPGQRGPPEVEAALGRRAGGGGPLPVRIVHIAQRRRGHRAAAIRGPDLAGDQLA
jgi:hypothetical protein